MAVLDPASERRNRRTWYYSPSMGVVLLTSVALAIRLFTLGNKSLLTDEGSSYAFSQLPISTLLWHLCDPHPPGYYLFLRAVAAFGSTEWWLRLPSALAGALAVPLTWLVAGQAIRPTAPIADVWPKRAALLAAGLVAFAPLHVWYSQEARAYALLSMLALVVVWAGLRWWLRPSFGSALLFLVFGWLALFVEYGTLTVWLGLNLFLLSGWPWEGARTGNEAGARHIAPASKQVRDRSAKHRSWQWLALQTALLAPFVVWWLASAQQAVWAGPSYQAIFLAVQLLSLGLDVTPVQARRLLPLTAIAVALIGSLLALATRRSLRVRRWLSSPLVAWLLLGLVVLLAVAGVVPKLYTVKRHLTVLVPFVSIATAWAWVHLWRNEANRTTWPRLITAGTIAALLGLSLAAVMAIPKPPWRAATARLASIVRAGDSVWVDEMDAPVFDYYWRERIPWRALVAKDLTALEAVPDGQRIWIISTVSPYRDLHQTLPSNFSRRRTTSHQLDWPGIALRAYDTRHQATPNGEKPPAPSQSLLWGLDLPSPLDTSCQ